MITETVLTNIIGGQEVMSKSARTLPVTAPLTGEVVAEVPLSTRADLDAAVRAAAEAQVAWGQQTVKDRQVSIPT
jgi:malonate-semialdehyde dehydrogenase (acetylating)/methylmalonate-semialdehyde dehydrogenase